MKTLKGNIISKGISSGTICLYYNIEESKIPHYTIEKKEVLAEIQRFENAKKKTLQIMKKSEELAKKLLNNNAAEIFFAHFMILQDTMLQNRIKNKIKNSMINAEHAINDVFDDIISEYDKKEAHFSELNQDFLEIRDRLLNSFRNSKGSFACDFSKHSKIIMASEYLTAETILNASEYLIGIIVKECGYTSHPAILARSLKIPTISGINVKHEVCCNDKAILDSQKGYIYIKPDKPTRKKYHKKIQILKKSNLLEIKYSLIKTKNNKPVKLKINLNTIKTLNSINTQGTDGIGLFRTEFVFLKSEFIPEVENQYEVYKNVAKSTGNKEVVIRLFDIDSDKIPSYLPLLEDKNLDLDIRGARAVELFRELYEKQMEALFLTAKEFDNIKILYPMISEFSDLKIFKDLYNKYKKKFSIKKKIPEGILIEVPSAAIISNMLIKHIDFLNIGSNDLFQYTLAASRSNIIAQKRYHLLHPSIIYLFNMVLNNAKKENKEVCLCGETASVEDFYPFLINIGFKSFSVSPYSYLRIRKRMENSEYKKINVSDMLNLKNHIDIEKFIKGKK